MATENPTLIEDQLGSEMFVGNDSCSVRKEADTGLWVATNTTLITVLALHTFLTLLCACLIVLCVMLFLKRQSQQREEREKITHIIQNYYWECEDQIKQFLKVMQKLKASVIFRDVSELHLLGYKYRHQDADHMSPGFTESTVDGAHSPLPIMPVTICIMNTENTLKKIDRLFDCLALQLPSRGRCQHSVSLTCAGNIYKIAQATSILWTDHKAALIKHTIQYLAGKAAARSFELSLIPDRELETLVVARVPYASQLSLKLDHFILKEVDISNDLKIDIRNKIRYVDTVLAKNDRALQMKEKTVTEAYYVAREICLKNNFVQNKNYLPDIVSKVGEASKVDESVVYLRHLLRLMCTPKNIRKLENDDKFFQFLMQLYEGLYTWADTRSMLEVIERSRNNIFSYLRGLTVEQILMDKEFTKAKLEHVEKELYRHLNYLTVKQVQEEKKQSGRRADLEARMRSVDSDSSIYTMAMSASSFMMRRQQSLDRPELDAAPHQSSVDQSSLLSGSSMYATAASLCSVNENMPLMARSPPTPHRGPLRLDPHHSPTSDSSDFFETAV